MSKKIIMAIALVLTLTGCGASQSTPQATPHPLFTAPAQPVGGTKPPQSRNTTPTPIQATSTPTPTPLLPLATCSSHMDLQDATCSPGVILFVGTDVICVSGYTRTVRNVTQHVRDQVFAEYGIRTHASGQYEVDHLIPLELGGSNDLRNLWPQSSAKPYGFHEKDQLENVLHSLVCNGKLALHQAQMEISTNWIAAYRKYVLNSVMP